MRSVSEAEDYSTRVEKSGNDEFGELAEVFNEMLGQVRQRDIKLGEHRRKLEQDVADRTRELQEKNDALEAAVTGALEAEASAQEASRVKGDFLATMSHEIRTPMNGVLGMTELLLGTELTQGQRKFAQTIHSSGEALLSIIDDVLNFSKAEAGKLQLETYDCYLREIVEGVVTLLAETASAKGIDLAGVVSEEIPAVLQLDGARLRQVITNLVGNAVKFTETGEVVVSVRSRPGRQIYEEPGQDARPLVLEVEVTDTGIGVPEEARATLFSAFSQADGSMARRYGGTGLGLAISRQLVELMRGEVSYEARARGSCFRFWIPVSVSSVPAAEPVEHSLEGVAALIVESNATSRGILLHYLEAWGCRVGSCETADGAMSELRNTAARGLPYDVVIVDLALPGVGGLELAGAIRDDRTLAGIEIMLLIPLGQSVSAGEMESLSIARNITKPVRRADLRRAVASATGTSREVLDEGQRESRGEEARDRRRAPWQILVAEDNPVNQEVASELLGELGCETRIASNGLQVLAEIEKARPDLVFMDCQMPKLDGYSATREIRRRESSRGQPRLPVVALTAHAMPGDRQKCLESGMDDYLSKPLSSRQLSSVLQAWLDRRETVLPEARPEVEPIDRNVLAELHRLADSTGSDVLGRVRRAFFESSARHARSIREAVRERDARDSWKLRMH